MLSRVLKGREGQGETGGSVIRFIALRWMSTYMASFGGEGDGGGLEGRGDRILRMEIGRGLVLCWERWERRDGWNSGRGKGGVWFCR